MRAPLDVHEYLVDEREDWDESNRLLDDDGAPRPGLSPAMAGLAAIAAALHQHGPAMTRSELERAVWFAKVWKSAKGAPIQRGPAGVYEFNQKKRGIEQSGNRLVLNKSGWRYAYASFVLAALLGFGLVLTALGWSEMGGGWRIGAAAGCFAVWMLAVGTLEVSRQRWRSLERQCLIASVREARCTEDLWEAGLFDEHDRKEPESAEELLALMELRRGRLEQLGDALYCDLDYFIRGYSGQEEQIRSMRWRKMSAAMA